MNDKRSLKRPKVDNVWMMKKNYINLKRFGLTTFISYKITITNDTYKYEVQQLLN